MSNINDEYKMLRYYIETGLGSIPDHIFKSYKCPLCGKYTLSSPNGGLYLGCDYCGKEVKKAILNTGK